MVTYFSVNPLTFLKKTKKLLAATETLAVG